MPQTTVAPRQKSAPIGSMPMGTLAQSDPEIARLIDNEVDRQRSGLELIRSKRQQPPSGLVAGESRSRRAQRLEDLSDGQGVPGIRRCVGVQYRRRYGTVLP